MNFSTKPKDTSHDEKYISTEGDHLVGGSFINSDLFLSDFKNTVPPENKKPSLGELEKKILEAGEKARLDFELRKKREARDSFIKIYNKEGVVNFNTKVINSSQNFNDLIQNVKVNKINIISRNDETGEFNLYNNDYLLEELNFINKYLGPEVNNSDKQDTENIKLAKLKAKGLTRACGIRYKVREILTGIK